MQSRDPREKGNPKKHAYENSKIQKSEAGKWMSILDAPTAISFRCLGVPVVGVEIPASESYLF